MTDWLWPVDFIFMPGGKMLMVSIFGGKFEDKDYVISTVDPSNENELKNLKPEDWTSVGRLTENLLIGGPVLELHAPDSPIVYFSDNKNVKGQRITADGNLDGAPFSALNAPAKKTRLLVSTVAFASTPKGTLADSHRILADSHADLQREVGMLAEGAASSYRYDATNVGDREVRC